MKLRHALALALASASFSAHATNWFQPQNTEPPNAKLYRVFGLLQPTYAYNWANGVTGLGGPANKYNGETPVFNLVPTMNQSTSAFSFFRARLGVRGAINRDINYFLLTEAGKNATTTKRDVVVTDAFLNFNYIPGARIRVGQGRMPIGDEGMQPAFIDSEYIYYSNATNSLMNEFPVATTSVASPIPPGSVLSNARTIEGGLGYRDLGVEVYDWFPHGKWEYAYAVMASTGSGLYSLGNDYGRGSITGRLQTSYIFSGKGLNRDDITGYVWYQTGKRHFGNQDYTRTRYGVGARYHKGKLRVSGEYLWGEGMIFTGLNPPFANAPVYQIALADSNKAQGGYLETGYYLLPKLEFDLRYDYFDRLTNSAMDERIFKTWTLGAQYHFKPNLRLQFNYAIRTLDVPNPAAISTANSQRSNAEILANSMGNLAAVQLTWFF